jgi:hypothetical protein
MTIELVQAIGAAGTGYLRYGIIFAPYFVDLHTVYHEGISGVQVSPVRLLSLDVQR